MQKKTTTYLLLILVASIWSFIGYKIYKTLNQSNDVEIHNSNRLEKNQSTEDTFSLLFNYDDPFTKRKFSSAIPSTKGTNNNYTGNDVSFNLNKPKNEIITSPIDIQFIGLIQNDIRKTGLISINGKSVFVKEGLLVDSIKIIRFNKTELLYKDNKGNKFIIRNKNSM